MKRSKAISNIKELIEINLESLMIVPDAELVADLILSHLEMAGMTPPAIDIKMTQLEWNPHKNTTKEVEVVVKRSMWEVEDK